MKYKPNNCKRCGGKTMGYGGIVDYLDKSGLRSDFEFRKSLFADFYGKEKYTGSAEQNLRFLKDIQKNSPAPRDIDTLPANRQQPTVQQNNGTGNIIRGIGNAAKQIPSGNTLESGVIVDKRTGKAYVIGGHKPIKEFPVLTGKNVEGNVNMKKSVASMTEVDRVTPVGYYSMLEKGNDVNIKDANKYSGNIMSLSPINAYDYDKPQATNLAIHQTYDPANRDKLYGTASPYASYGCINCKKPDIEYIMNRFPKGDTLNVVDSKTSQGMATLKRYGIKQTGGLLDDCPDGMVRNPQTGECEIPNMTGETQYFQTGYDNYGKTKGYNPMNATYQEAAKAEQFTTTNPTLPSKTSIPSKKIDPYFALMGAQNGLSWLSNLMDRKRQNQYMRNQLSTLGQMNAMPVEDFQPNPYNLYSKYGGSIKKYQKGGEEPNPIWNESLDFVRFLKQDYKDFYAKNPKGDGWDAYAAYVNPSNPAYKGYDGNSILSFLRDFNNTKPKSLVKDLNYTKETDQKSLTRRFRPAPQDASDGFKKGGNWIPKNLKKGRCTPLGNPDCPEGSPQYNLAVTFKKHHGFH